MAEPNVETGDPCPPISISERWPCHAETTWTTATIRHAMLGTWEWKYAKCFFGTDDRGCLGADKYIVEVGSDGTLVVLYNGTVVQTATWHVIAGEHENEFTVETEPAVYRLSGYIVICDDVIGFEEIYIDGCNNYFKRKT